MLRVVFQIIVLYQNEGSDMGFLLRIIHNATRLLKIISPIQATKEILLGFHNPLYSHF